MDLSEIARVSEAEAERRLQRGMAAWAVPEPMTLDEWAQAHFYLSAESSYVEQRWTPWTFQRGILACISNDDIYEIDVKKSARVGYTKMLLAAMGYNAEHKRRNQALWQPTDDDAVAFVKTELDPMLRDVPVMRAVFPAYLARHKDNTLDQKKFIGSMTHIKGGKAAKNYRRISIDAAFLDELDAFDNDVEKEGDPFTLAAKRVEGATFPKVVCGSTPKLKGFSLIDGRFALADERMTFQIPCPHCGERHALTWGGKDEAHGLKFTGRNPDTVRHLCPHCGALIDQGEFLAVESQGVWINETGTLWLHADGRWTCPDGTPAATPRHVGVCVWTAYSPAVAWSQIVREFLAALEAMERGDDSKMKAWTNTTRGETWEGEIEATEADELKARAEPFKLGEMPRDCLLLLAGCDTQDNRIEVGVWGYGRGGRMWTIAHHVIFGNPAEEDIWRDLEDYLFTTEFPHASGLPQKIFASAIDSGGHHTDAVYAFAHKHKARRVHAVKGSSARERSIENGNSQVGFDWRGKREKRGPVLWMVGTNLSKDRFHARLDITTPGPGYVHLSADLSDEWFRQLAGEVRATRRTMYGTESRWTATRKRIEVRDCMTYTIWLEERLDLWAPKRRSFWDALEESVQPAIGDLFAQQPKAAQTAEQHEKQPEEKLTARPAPRTAPRPVPRRNFPVGW